MASEAVDGPGLGAVFLARAEIERRAGNPGAARDALAQALESFYGRMGQSHHEAWFRVQLAFLSLELGDGEVAARRLALARKGFEQCEIPLGLSYCDALEGDVRTANGTLTPGA